MHESVYESKELYPGESLPFPAIFWSKKDGKTLLLFLPFFWVLCRVRAYEAFQAMQIVFYLAFLLHIACIDARWHRIPNALTGALAVAGMTRVLLFFPLTEIWRRFLFAGFFGTVVVFFAYGFPGFGMGDAKLLIGMALAEGIHLTESLLLGLLCCFFSALFKLIKTGNRSITLPFAPFLFFGAYVSIALGG